MQIRSKTFTYRTSVQWSGERKGVARAEGKPDLGVATPPEFKGHEGIWSPEDLFVTSVNVCLLTSFLSVAERAGLEFSSYESDAEGKLELVDGAFRFTHITLRPRLFLSNPEERAKAEELLGKAESICLISNSITAEVEVLADIR